MLAERETKVNSPRPAARGPIADRPRTKPPLLCPVPRDSASARVSTAEMAVTGSVDPKEIGLGTCG